MECSFVSADANALATALWNALSATDQSLPVVPQEGVGEARGHHMHVKWARSTTEPFFVCEVVDARSHQVWEAGVADIGRPQPMAFWRCTSGELIEPPTPWQAAIRSAGQIVAHTPPNPPTFLTMLAAFLANSPPVLVEDRSSIALLQDDLAYWRDLAMSQARLIRRSTADAAERLEAALAARGLSADKAPKQAEPRRWALRDLDEWAAINSARIVVLPRAIAAAKRSEYLKPEIVYAGLELLAGTYRAVKKGELDRHVLKAEVDALGFLIGGSVDPSVAGELGEEYFVRWRGRRRFLDQHMGKGSARDERHTMRIYWTWDEDDEVCVVGWLPSHLSTSRS